MFDKFFNLCDLALGGWAGGVKMLCQTGRHPKLRGLLLWLILTLMAGFKSTSVTLS